MRSTFSVAVAAATIATVNARATYVARIPNGDNVSGVQALGHVDPNGGGANNEFGLNFEAAGESWTTEFCQLDSDGDGQTNGQELGDPCCEWVQDSNAVTRWSDGVSHPGDASSTSDESLWADITCGSSTSNTNTTTTTSSGSTTAAVGSNSNTPAAGSTTQDAAMPGSASSSAASTVTPMVYSATGVVLAVATYFL